MAPSISELKNKMERIREKTISGRYFADPDEVKKLLKTSTTAKALAECDVPDYQIQNISQKIVCKGTILFSILIWRGWHRRLTDFIEHGVWDAQLPLDASQVKSIVESIAIEFAHEAQWEFLPRKLTKEMQMYHYKIRKDEILPFVQEKGIGNGSLAEVFEILVPTSLQNILVSPAPTTALVLKKLRKPEGSSKVHQNFQQREKECLRILDHMRHPNVVQLLASFSYCNQLHLLFPVFKMDLEAFMSRTDRYGNFKHDFVIYDALRGLSSAIKMVHCFNIKIRGNNQDIQRISYHHDIRPANILVDGKTFYLADFGLSRMKAVDENSQTRWKAGLGDFLGPECYDSKDLSKGEVGRPLDIWSFGCSIFEVAAYVHGGRSGVEDFQKLRQGHAFRSNMADRYFFTGKTVRPAVLSWANETRARNRDHSLRSLLELSCSMLQIDPADRPLAPVIEQQLCSISFHALEQAATTSLGKAFDTPNLLQLTISSKEAQLQCHRFVAWTKVIHLEDNHSQNSIVECYHAIRPALLSIFELGKAMQNSQKDSNLELVDHDAFFEQFSHQVDILYNAAVERSQKRMRHMLLSSLSALEDLPSQSLDWPEEVSKFYATRNQEQFLTEEDAIETQSSESESDRSRIPLDSLNFLDEVNDNVVNATFQDVPVIIEFVPKTHKWLEIRQREQQQRLSNKVEALRQGSSVPGFAILKCIGYFMATSKPYSDRSCGLIYSLPARQNGKGGRTVPISLATIIRRRSLVSFPLEERFQLAHRLALCVYELHIAGWLHKNITSENIIFFECSLQESNVTFNAAPAGILQAPYLINFRHARPTLSTHQTEKANSQASSVETKYTKHPDYIAGKRNSETVDDYYGLGIVLLELGSWATLDAFLDKCRLVLPEPEIFRLLLIEKYAPRLKHLMGTAYTNTTLACLKSDLNIDLNAQDPEGRSAMILEKFYDQVVDPLRLLSQSPL